MENNSNIEKIIETPISEIDFGTKILTVRIVNALRRTNLDFNVFNIVFLGNEGLKRINNLGAKAYGAIKNKLKEYGIDIDDKEQCNYLIKQYMNKKQEINTNILELLDKPLKNEVKGYSLLIDTLNSKGYNTLYDIISEDKNKIRILLRKKTWDYKEQQYISLSLIFVKYGINIKDEIQCEELTSQYQKEKEKIKKELSMFEKESETDNSVKQIKEVNESLEDEITHKQRILEEFKSELEKNKELKQQLSECDRKFNELIKEYYSLSYKESSNNHGTK